MKVGSGFCTLVLVGIGAGLARSSASRRRWVGSVPLVWRWRRGDTARGENLLTSDGMGRGLSFSLTFSLTADVCGVLELGDGYGRMEEVRGVFA